VLFLVGSMAKVAMTPWLAVVRRTTCLAEAIRTFSWGNPPLFNGVHP
jgi:hypothetical protein